MTCCFVIDRHDHSVDIAAFTPATLEQWLKQQPEATVNWVTNVRFSAKEGSVCLMPGQTGSIGRVLLGLGERASFWAFGALPRALPQGIYRIDETKLTPEQCRQACIAWGLGTYQYNRYKTENSRTNTAQLHVPENCDSAELEALISAVALTRDLINTPTENMGPAELGSVAEELAHRYGGTCSIITGEALLTHNYPAVYAVGKASSHPPRLIDLRFGAAHLPKVTLVGKGVCFDSGGLDIKSSSGMRYMKKDMAGAAHVLGLAQLLVQQEFPIQLRVLIPAVENAVSGNSYHPGDIITMRSGKTVEITNTDAEGRLILADALVEASREEPELLINFATLTGAARIALGPDLSALMTPNDELAQALSMAADKAADPLWRLPLYPEYKSLLDSPIADMVNASLGDQGAGAITAGLFLEAFVTEPNRWAHFDVMAWNATDRPGRPSGGEAHGMRAVYEYLKERYVISVKAGI